MAKKKNTGPLIKTGCRWQPDCILPSIFFEGRSPIASHPESIEFQDWVDEQTNRCLSGLEYGGYKLNGYNYFYLNFWRPDMIHLGNGVFEETYVFYSDVDQEFFNYIELAKEKGKGLAVITGRGFGKTIAAGSIVGRDYTFFPGSESIISTSTDSAIIPFWNKLKTGLNNMPSFFYHQRIKDTDTFIKSGFKVKEHGEEREYGYGSKIEKVIFDNKSGKTRGRRPTTQIFEEIGSWTGAAKLKECYKASMASWWIGTHFKTLPILIGTGGEMKSGGSEDIKEMAYNPEEYNLLSFIDPSTDKKTIYFIPAYRKFGGTYEKTGISRVEEAKEFLINRREIKKNNPDTYYSELQEFPFTLEEAFLIEGGNFFNSSLIYNRITEIERDKSLSKRIQKGNLNWVKNDSGGIIDIKWEQDINGDFEILEHPVKTSKKENYRNLYVSGCDSYDSFGTDSNKGESSRSKGSIFMFKRHLFGQDLTDCFVAKCTIRPQNSNDFYEATYKLNYYYGAKMLYEHTKIGILDYYIRNKLHYMLMERPKVAYDSVKVTVANNKYGLSMPQKIKHYALDEYSKYLHENLYKVFFTSLLLDAINFSFESNKHDETMAATLAIVADLELFETAVKEKEEKKRLVFPTFAKDSYGRLAFK